MVKRKNYQYILFAEYHKDGKGIHFHGLANGDLDMVDSGHRTKNGSTNNELYELEIWFQYSNRTR